MSSSRHTKRLANRNIPLRLLLICVAAIFSTNAEFTYAAMPTQNTFATNFNPNKFPFTGFVGQTVGYCNPCFSDYGNGDPTAFGLTPVSINGVVYFHTLVGNPASGFAIESYTRAAGYAIDPTTGLIADTGGAFSPDGGGNERAAMTPADQSGAVNATPPTFLQNATNSGNPLGIYDISGTGSQDPTKTVFRMVLSDAAGGMSMEVYKPFLDKKPRISQTVTDATMTSVFVTDQTALSYNDSSTAAPVVNNVVVNDPQLPSTGSADFEMALAQAPDVTSGRFIYTAGSGWVDPVNGWDKAVNPTTGLVDPTASSFGEGTYSYVDGAGFDPLNFDWSTVFDPTQNVSNCNGVTNGGIYSVARKDVGSYGGSGCN